MAHVDDRARYYLERAVPQLREFETKEIFSRDEIRTLVSKRTEFESLILSPGSQPADVLAYIAWDQALDKLRAKRCSRLKIKQSTAYTSQGRIFQTFERGVTRHPGSLLLWRRYLEYAAQCKATKRWRRVMTRALRMLPNDSELWVIAGLRASQDGDMEGARGYFMRGCRFCTDSPLVWVEYVRLEMQWLAKLEKKKGTAQYNASVAALLTEGGKGKAGTVYEEGEGMALNDGDGGDGDADDASDDDDGDFSNAAILPKSLTDAAAAKTKPAVFSDEAVRKLEATPALEGAIPRAVFDAATKQPFFTADAAEAFFDVLALFGTVSSQPALVRHVLAAMDERFPQAPATWNCRAKHPLLGLNPDSPAFPGALRAALATIWDAMGKMGGGKAGDKTRFAAKSSAWIDVLLARDGLDEGLAAVLQDTRRKLERAAAAETD